jgi:hypothetical protein
MANYGFDDLVIAVDDSNGDAQDLSQYITEISAFGVEAVLEDAHTAGDAWVEKLFVGLKQASEFTLGGFYDDTASVGPRVILDAIGATRTVTLTWGTGKTSSMDCLVKKWDRSPGRGENTKFTSTLVPTGTVAEA